MLAAGYLATDSQGQTFVVVAMLSDPSAALPPSATAGLLAIVQGAFRLVRSNPARTLADKGRRHGTVP